MAEPDVPDPAAKTGEGADDDDNGRRGLKRKVGGHDAEKGVELASAVYAAAQPSPVSEAVTPAASEMVAVAAPPVSLTTMIAEAERRVGESNDGPPLPRIEALEGHCGIVVTGPEPIPKRLKVISEVLSSWGV